MRPPMDNPKTRMKSALESTGAAIVWVHSLVTRATSRPERAIRPRWRSAKLDTAVTLAGVVPDDPDRLGTAPRGHARPRVHRRAHRRGDHQPDGEHVRARQALPEHGQA